MTMHRKTITLTKQQDDWVKGQIATGNFGNDSEYIRDLIRRDKEYHNKVQVLRQALIDGENSGPAIAFDIDQIRSTAKSRVESQG